MNEQIATSPPPDWLFAFFPFAFVGMWLTISTLLGFASGWFSLQRRYPKGSDAPLCSFLMKSGSLGSGNGPFGSVSMGGILNISACPDGLRVGIFRPFGPFQRPFEVPWRDIKVERATLLFLPRAKLIFGDNEGALSLDVALWNRVATHAPDHEVARLSVQPVAVRALAGMLLVAWAVVTALIGTFFLLTSRIGAGQPMPVLQCYAMPAALAAIAALVYWLRQLR
jgi:hypothetical protein